MSRGDPGALASRASVHASAQGARSRLGLRENLAQFTLLALMTFNVGLVVGAERVVAPALAARAFHLVSFLATLSFIISFGVVKALLNLVAGRLSDRIGRKPVLLAGWLVALPVPFMIIFAPSWGWVVAANALLGVNQGFTWTVSVTSKIDLVGPRRRGLALGINESSGYLGVSLGGFAGGALAGAYGLRVAPFLFVLAVVLVSLAASWLFIRETLPYTRIEAGAAEAGAPEAGGPPLRTVFALATWGDRALGAAAQAGLVEKFTDTLAWGLFPLYFTSQGLDLATVGALVAVYTGSWAALQLYTGHLTDRVGRKWPIVSGMWLAGGGVALVAASHALAGWVAGALLMGVGMALLYPTLLAAVSDVAHPRWRGAALGVYRLWRDAGYAIGGLAIGVVADRFGLLASFWSCAALMGLSGLAVALLMYETQPARRQVHPAWERDPRFD